MYEPPKYQTPSQPYFSPFPTAQFSSTPKYQSPQLFDNSREETPPRELYRAKMVASSGVFGSMQWDDTRASQKNKTTKQQIDETLMHEVRNQQNQRFNRNKSQMF